MTAKSVASTDTLEVFRTTVNTLSSTDIGDLATLSSTISATSLVGALNEIESEVTPFSVTSITSATDLGAAPATGDTFLINDTSASALREMTVANLFTTPTITTPIITEIDSGSTITLDAATDIVLDAGGADIFLKDDGTTFGSLTATGSDLIIKSGTTTALTFSGANVTIAGNLTVSGSTTTVDSTTISIQNSFVFEGATADSFETTLTTVDPTADRTLSLPNATDTLVGKATTDTLTNKTLTAPTISNPIFTGTASSAGNIVFEGATADSFETTLTVTDPTADRTITLPNATDTLVGKATTDTLTNKTLTAPTITAPTITGNFSLVFEGSTADSFETTVGVIDPTADRTVNIANATGTLQPFAAASTTAISTTPAEINLIDGGTARGTDAVGDGDGILINDGGTMRMTNVQTVSAYMAAESVGGGNIVTTGALDSGSITSGFGTINNGSSTITTTGVITAGGLTIGSAVIIEAELEMLDGITAGTVSASKCLVVDGSKDLTALNDVRMDSLGIATAASGTSGEIRATNDVTAFYSSDISFKENIVEIPSALDMVDKIRGVFFDWKDDYIESKGGEDDYFMRKHDVGLIAQEVEKVLPEVVGTRTDGTKAIKYDRLVPLLLQAIKELKNKL